MSADNGIYIGCFGDGDFRVIHATAIDNLIYQPNFHGVNAKQVYNYFKNGKSFPKLDEALIEAENMADSVSACGPLEYGVSQIHFPVGFTDFYNFSLTIEGGQNEQSCSSQT